MKGIVTDGYDSFRDHCFSASEDYCLSIFGKAASSFGLEGWIVFIYGDSFQAVTGGKRPNANAPDRSRDVN